jgi:toxin ParE1/3/4
VKVVYSSQAANDLWQIERHYAERVSLDLSQRLAERIKSKLERLVARHPRVGRLRPEFGQETRSVAAPPYVIFYRPEGQRIYVLRILHGHRDIQPPLMSLLLAS